MSFYYDKNNTTIKQAKKAKISEKIFVGLNNNFDNSPAQILIVIQNHFSLRPEDFFKTSRKENIVTARKVAIYLIHYFTNGDITFKELAHLVGYYNKGSHATAIHHFRDVNSKIELYPEFKEMINDIKIKCFNYLQHLDNSKSNQSISDGSI